MCIPLVDMALKTTAILRPEFFEKTFRITLAEGEVQSYPDGMLRVRPQFNIVGGAPLTLFDRVTMDAVHPQWRVDDKATPQQWSPRDGNTTEFLVWPPAAGGEQLEFIGTQDPDQVTTTAAVLPLNDSYLAGLANYVCFRLEAADDEHVLSQRAILFWTQYLNEIGADPRTPPQ
jgi:hypothetical protein